MSLLSKIFGGKGTMSTLSTGAQAPQFELPTMDGQKFSLQEALTSGPVLTVFFKVSCPVCQYALPFFQRVYKAYGRKNLSMVGISQNEQKDTAEFMKRYGLTMPVLLDNTKSFPVSNAYRLTSVPTSFWISQDRVIEISSVGWSRSDFEEMVGKAASETGNARTPIFQASEQIADFRAG